MKKNSGKKYYFFFIKIIFSDKNNFAAKKIRQKTKTLAQIFFSGKNKCAEEKSFCEENCLVKKHILAKISLKMKMATTMRMKMKMATKRATKMAKIWQLDGNSFPIMLTCFEKVHGSMLVTKWYDRNFSPEPT